MSELLLPWWTRFGRQGTDGLTMLERRHLAKKYAREARPSLSARKHIADWREDRQTS